MPSSGAAKEIKAEEESPLLADGATDAQSYGTTTAKAVTTDGDETVATPSTAPEAKNYFESLDYEHIESSVYADDFQNRPRFQRLQHVFFKWTFALLIGICTGTTAFLINMAVENIGGFKFSLVGGHIRDGSYLAGFFALAFTNTALVAFAAALCQYVSLEAAGSGIPEVKAYLNGVDTPRIFAPKTLLVKVLGSIGSVAGGLAVGKEGPLVHTGACFANIMGQGGSRRYHLTAKWLRFFKNDSDRRDLVTCGAAAGVAAAFRAPVGGVLMALEEVTSWWRSSLLWRVFFCNAVVAVTLQTLMSACEGGSCGHYSSGGFIIFDNSEAKNNFGLLELLPVALLGATGGVLGSLFNHLNLRLNKWRQRCLPKSPGLRVAEACAIALLTAALRVGAPFLAPCIPCPDVATTPKAADCPSNMGNYVSFNCPPGHYNDLAGLLFATNDDCARNLFSTGTGGLFTYRSLLIFFGIFYPVAILTYGVTVPSGLFVPSIISGATYGRMVGMLMTSWAGEHRVDQGTYALLGAASFLGGSMRMTVSISIILLELTGSLRMLPLIMLTLLVSKTIGDSFNGAIYDAHIHLKGIPFLEARPELFMRQLKARDAVVHDPVPLPAVDKVRNILRVLRDTPHNAYPVCEDPDPSTGVEAVCHGLILRRHILVLLKGKECLQATRGAPAHPLGIPFEEFGKPGSGKGLRVEDVEVSEEELEMYLDLRPFVNKSHYFVGENMSLSKVYALFRSLGLRHLCVVPAPSKILGVITRKDLLPETYSERRLLDKLQTSF